MTFHQNINEIHTGSELLRNANIILHIKEEGAKNEHYSRFDSGTRFHLRQDQKNSLYK